MIAMNIKTISISICLLLLTSLMTSEGFAATTAGRVVFALGKPQAVDTAGAGRELKKGDDVFSGDRLITGRGRLQISLVDGAFISVQPNSEYHLENYQYAGKQDGTEQAIYRLAKGGVRAVTGLIGKQNPDAYKVHTAVATIGIRGTGHNTRICAGDCGSIKDGLYHNTWEGITYVENDVDTQDVPAGKGVYVERIDTPIEPLAQPAGVTAVETTREKVDEEEKETEETREDAAVISSGEQRNAGGDQVAAVGEDTRIPGGATFSEVLSGQAIVGTIADLDDPESVDDFRLDNTAIFTNSDGKPIGVLGNEDDNGVILRQFATIDLAAMLGGNDPAAVEEVTSLLAAANNEQLAFFNEKPAQVAEFTPIADLGLGRWADGRVLSIDADTTDQVVIDDLTANQSVHFIFGPEPATIPTLGSAVYDFVGGTQSTSASGATIGNGVIRGGLFVDFNTSFAALGIDVDHAGILYSVGGPLTVDTANNGFFDILGLEPDSSIKAVTTAANSACNPSCPTFIEGLFFSPDVNGFPKFAGLEYDIQETDVVSGVAAFELFGSSTASSTATSGLVLQVVTPDTDPGSLNEADEAGLFGVTLFSNAGGDPISFLGTEEVNDGMGGTDVFIRFATIDLNGMLNSNAPAQVAGILGALGVADPADIASFRQNPATVAEFTTIGDIGFGRWANGRVLTTEVQVSTAGGVTTTTPLRSEVRELNNNQSLHFAFGPEPEQIPTSGSGTYSFLGGTKSTSVSGATIGNGIQGGSINVNFGTSNASIGMSVDHAGTNYSVSGNLTIDTARNDIFETPNSVTAMTTAPSACNPSCNTFIDGGFAGPLNASNQPKHIGIEYDIQETDAITGVGVFGNP